MSGAPIAQRLREAADGLQGERVALSHLADLHGPAAQGTLLVLLAAPCMLPMPGVGSVLGIGLALMALAMWRGQDIGQLPPRVARLELSTPWARRVLSLLARFYGLAGRWSRQRLARLVHPPQRRGSWLAAQAGLMAALIILPIPFGNVLPALALMLLGLGLVFRDGLAVLAAAGMAGLAVLYTAGLGLAAWVWGLAPLMAKLQA